MRKILIFLSIAFIFSGCLAKMAKPYTFYELTYQKSAGVCNSSSSMKNLYVNNVSATALADRREFIILDYKKQIVNIGNAMFVTTPSDMVYKSLINAVFSSCRYKPIFVPNANDLRLDTNLITLSVNNNEAIFTIAYDLYNLKGSLKSGIITKKVVVKSPNSQDIFDAMNKAMNDALNELMRNINL